MSKATTPAAGYTVIYYELCSQLGLSFDEYIILNEMVRSSERNEFNNSITYLSDRLGYSRNTVYKNLKALWNKGYFQEKNGSTYQLNWDAKDTLETPKHGKFVIIDHGVKAKYKLSTNQTGLLYLYLSY